MNADPVIITLGSNIDPERCLPAAVTLLAAAGQVRLLAASRVYQTLPVNAAGEIDPRQGYFLNAALRIDTPLEPDDLKRTVLRPVEEQLGRVRSADKFAPRTIDLDLALYGSRVSGEPGRLQLPDPDILRRAHVALPLADLAPAFVHPVTGQTLAAIAAAFAHVPGLIVREDVVLRI